MTRALDDDSETTVPPDDLDEVQEYEDQEDTDGGAAPLPADRLLYPRVARLTSAEEADLARRIGEGDSAAEARLVEAHIYLVIAVARRQLGRGVALADLVQEGALGLVIAARRWQSTGEARFATYAEHWVKARVRRAISGASLVLTANAEARRGQIAGARARLRVELGREPSEEELAEAAGLTLRQLRTPRPAVVGLDDALGETGDDATFADVAVDSHTADPSNGAQQLAVARRLHEAMDRARLTERERAVLSLRYGLDDEEPRAFRDIGEALGIKHPSQLVAHEASALRKLRVALSEPAGQSISESKRSYGPGSRGVSAGITRRRRGGTVGSIRSARRASASAASSSLSSSTKSAPSVSTSAGMARAGRT
jgi:RNA polymerase sigma factor (sigma-70 family)